MSTSSQGPADADAGAPHIAVIGVAGRFPLARSADEFWENIAAGRECVSFFSPEEVREAGMPEAMRGSRDFVPARAIIADPFHFDAPFFGFSPMEAKLTDPQHRLFLECAWEALERAGYDPSRATEAIGVYAGADANSYALGTMLLGATDMLSLLGSDKDYLATRASYKLDLRGPGVTIQTACSTSLVAVQLACQGLLGYQCDIALAGGVGVAFPQKAGYVYQPGGILSPDGRCRPFDAKAKGTVGGDGIGVVVLKRLGDALRDGDPIHAVIRGAAINNDGAQKMGFTAPSVRGQAEVITMALEMAEVDPTTISYVECHGTATELGDPVEISALTDAYRAYTDKQGYCAIGSVKGNVGHMNSAAGVGGLIKTIMALRHRQIPPSLHFESPNPMLDLPSSPFFVSTRLSPWVSPSGPRRAGVSSFGVGGTNAHVILEEAPPRDPSGPSRIEQLLVVSAKSEAALAVATENLLRHLEQRPELPLADAAYTLLVGRQLFKHRRMAVVRGAGEAARALAAAPAIQREPRRAPVVFLFPGQGAQKVNMARDVYDAEPTFREEVDAMAEILRPILGVDLRAILFPDQDREEEAAAKLRETRLAQPALFVVEYALARLWMSWGVKPEAMLGHSIGEYVAACLAGVMPLDAALQIVAARGSLVQQQPAGAMLAAGIHEDEAAARFPGVSVAALNAPGVTVLSGTHAAIEAAERELKEREVEHTRLHTSHAFHSPLIAPAAEGLRAALSKHPLSAPSIPYLSNVTGTWITPAEATCPAYWARHLQKAVRFADGMAELLEDPDRILLEVGPGRSLTALVARHGAKARERAVPSLAHARDDGGDRASLLEAAGRLYLADVAVDWRAFYAHERRLRVELPTYPFERHAYARDLSAPLFEGAQPIAPVGKRPRVTDWLYVPSWTRSANLPAPAELGGPWLVLSDGSRLAAAITERLARAGATVVTAIRGASFQRIAEASYAIDPAAPGDYQALLSDLAQAGASPRRVLHLFSLPASSDAEGGHDDAMRAGFFSLLFLGQALARRGGEPLWLGVVASEVRAALGDERVHPARATLLAPALGIAQELPHVTTSLLDLRATDGEDPRLADRILAELGAPPLERVVALRGVHRWTSGFEPARSAAARRPALRERGVYLIVGGTGGVGLAIAEHLARAARARLVLTGRSGMIATEEWDAWLSSHGEDDRMSRRIKKIRGLEALGAEVLVRSADVADERQMAQVIEQARGRFGEIHGAVHAAGIVGAEALRALVDTSPSHCEAHFRPKIQGLSALARALPRGLDFVLLCSSLATALGGVGLTAYAAAGHYMDAFAEERARRGEGRWISVDWDAWAIHDARGDAGGLRGPAILPEEGAAALDAILSLEGEAQVVVSTVDLAARREQIQRLTAAAERTPSASASAGAGPRATHARPDLDTPFVAPTSELEATLADLWQTLLGIDRIGVNDNFFKLGGDSLLAIQLGTRLRERLGVEIPVNDLFSEPTLRGLAARIEAIGAKAGAGKQAVETTLAMVENLSDEEVKRMLAELSR